MVGSTVHDTRCHGNAPHLLFKYILIIIFSCRKPAYPPIWIGHCLITVLCGIPGCATMWSATVIPYGIVSCDLSVLWCGIVSFGIHGTMYEFGTMWYISTICCGIVVTLLHIWTTICFLLWAWKIFWKKSLFSTFAKENSLLLICSEIFFVLYFSIDLYNEKLFVSAAPKKVM